MRNHPPTADPRGLALAPPRPLLEPLPSLERRRLVTPPVPLTSLIGREREAAAVAALLGRADVRLVTLTGPGGVGKTRLALAAAATVAGSFADGVAFVALAPVADPAHLLPAIARATGVRDGLGESAGARLGHALGDARMLLVLDNLEHLLAAGPDLADLLAGCPGLTALVTSRSLLGVSGERAVAVRPLPLARPTAAADAAPAAARLASPAVRLFVERARAVAPDVALAADTATIAAICRRLDGLPLAIELAAARTPVLEPRALLARIEQRLPLLTDGPRDQPHRLRSIHEAIAWSYDLLTAEERALFRRLAVFAGGFTLDAAEEVGGATVAGLGALVRHSLVGRAEGGGGEDGGARFAMLETVREFALERLAASGETEPTGHRHAAAVAALVERAEPHLPGPDERAWQIRLEADLENIRAALAWGLAHDPAVALRIDGALWGFWTVTGLMGEGRRWLETALAAGASAPLAVRAKASLTAGAIAMVQGDMVGGRPAAEAGLALWRETGDPLGEARALWIVGVGRAFTGHVEDGARLLERSLVLFEADEGRATAAERVWAARTLCHLGIFAFMGGDRERGVALSDEGVARGRDAGSPIMLLLELLELGGLLLDRGEPADRERARAVLEESLARAWTYGEWWIVAGPLYSLGSLAAAAGDPTRAVRLIGAAEALAEKSAATPPLPIQNQIDRALAQAEQALGPEAVAAERVVGRGWPLAQAVAVALGGRVDAGGSGPAAKEATLGLTPRQLAVLRLLVDGQTDKAIAEALFISRATASNHVAAILDRLGVDSRTAAVAIALRHGLA